jgi:cytochrome c-type biogenesis protein CcmH/NrfF
MGDTGPVAWLWIAPAGIALVGTAVLAGLARRAGEEMIGLRQELENYRRLRSDLRR